MGYGTDMRYKKLGFIKKKSGLQLYEFHFDYSLLGNDETQVFVISKPKRKRTEKRHKVENESEML